MTRGGGRLAMLGAMLAMAGGCGRDEGVEARDAGAGTIAEQVAANPSLAFTPGRWEATLTVLPADDAPPAMAGRLAERSVSTASCLSDAQAARPSADFFAKASKDCVYESFAMGEGKLRATMRCRQPAGDVVSTLAGTYARDRYDIKVDSRVGGAAGTAVSMTMAARQVGPCRGDETP